MSLLRCAVGQARGIADKARRASLLGHVSDEERSMRFQEVGWWCLGNEGLLLWTRSVGEAWRTQVTQAVWICGIAYGANIIDLSSNARARFGA